jgi:hypothetical protein
MQLLFPANSFAGEILKGKRKVFKAVNCCLLFILAA